MAPSTPPPPSKVWFAAFTTASTSSRVMSPCLASRRAMESLSLRPMALIQTGPDASKPSTGVHQHPGGVVVREIPGIHHITAIAGDPQRNVDFYVGAVGLRMVKRTVNFDDPGTYHLYYGDESGRPGSLLTFFPWPGAPRGRVGTGQATATSYSIPPESVGYWLERLQQHHIATR